MRYQAVPSLMPFTHSPHPHPPKVPATSGISAVLGFHGYSQHGYLESASLVSGPSLSRSTATLSCVPAARAFLEPGVLTLLSHWRLCTWLSCLTTLLRPMHPLLPRGACRNPLHTQWDGVCGGMALGGSWTPCKLQSTELGRSVGHDVNFVCSGLCFRDCWVNKTVSSRCPRP